MNCIQNKRLGDILVAGFFILLLAGVAYGWTEDNITKSFNVREGGTLNIDTDLGSVEVYGQNGNTVDIEVIRKFRDSRRRELLDRFDLDFEKRGDDVYITGDFRKERSRFWNSISNRLRIRFIVYVPEIYNVDLHTSGGGISVQDLQGQVVSKTSGGGLDFENIRGTVYGRTSGGGIGIGDVVGDVDVHTSGGSIRAAFIDGDVEADTSGGGITIEEVKGAVNAHTSGGSVKAYFATQPESDCRLSTSGGSITATIADGIGFFVDAHTSGGGIYNDFPVLISGRIDKKHLKADINGGGPELYLRTSGGSIHIRKK